MILAINVPDGERCADCAFKCTVRESNYCRGYDVTRCRIFDEKINDGIKCQSCKNQQIFVKQK